MLWLVYFLCVCVFVSLIAYFYYTTPNIGVLYIHNNNNNIFFRGEPAYKAGEQLPFTAGVLSYLALHQGCNSHNKECCSSNSIDQ